MGKKVARHTRKVNIFYSHVAAGVSFSLLGLWMATQYCAYALGYQAQLGHLMIIVKGYPVYEPWAWWSWAYSFGAYAPWVFQRASWITYGNFALMSGLMIFLAVRRSRNQANSGSYGTARWAEDEELKKAGLFSDKGVFLAQTSDAKFEQELDKDGDVRLVQKKPGKYFLRHNGPEHVIAFAPTRSGKGVGLVIPTLLTWTGSVLIYDIKKENWNITSGWRSKFSHCLCFEPTSMDSVKYNPLLEIRKGINEVRDVQNIADILVDPEGSKERKDHWEKTGYSLLIGVILHVLYAEKDKTLNGVATFLSNPKESIGQTIKRMINTKHLGDKAHPVVASIGRELFNKSENELSGVVSTSMSFLSLYRDPVVAKNTSSSDFAISDLMNSEKAVSLYIVIPPSDVERTKPLVRLMLNQIGRRLTEKMDLQWEEKETFSFFHKLLQKFKSTPEKTTETLKKHQLLMMLDEFATLGRLSFFESGLTFMAGYGIRAYLIVQSLNQLEQAYGQNNSIVDNCHVRITYGALNEQTALRISKLLGEKTEIHRAMNFAGNRLAPWLGHVMQSEHESARNLLTPGEILQLPIDDALVMVGGMPPYRGKKITYYQDGRFKGRPFIDPPTVESEKLTHPENVWLSMPVIEAPSHLKSEPNENDMIPLDAYGVDVETGEVIGEEGLIPNDMYYGKDPMVEKERSLEQFIAGDEQEFKNIDKTIKAKKGLELKKQTIQKKMATRARQMEIGRSDSGGGLPL